MFDQAALRDELNSLKVDLSRVLNTTGDEILNGAKTTAETLADLVKTTLNNLGDTLSEEDGIEKLISGRPIASLASAFALGVVVGVMLRRH